MNNEIDRLLSTFTQNRRGHEKRLVALLESDPSGFKESAVRYLCNDLPSGTEDSTVQYIVWLLEGRGMLVDILLNPAYTSVTQAVELGRILRDKAKRLDVELAKKLREASSDQSERILRVLAETADNNRPLPLLIRVLREKNPKLRRAAGRIFARHCQNELFIANALKDPDPGVRASALEGLGQSNQGKIPAVLLGALNDPDPSVQAHAILACHRLGDQKAIQLLEERAKSPKPEVRARMAWAMGRTKSPGCIPLVEALQKDPDASVRTAASEALQWLPKRPVPERERVSGPMATAPADDQAAEQPEHPAPPPLSLEVLYTRAGAEGKRMVCLSVTTAEGEDFTDFEQQHFVVEENGEPVTSFEVFAGESRGAMHLALVLDCSGGMAPSELQEIRTASISSLKYKQPGDLMAAFKFSLDVACASPFTSDPRRLRALLGRPHPGYKTASRLHDGVLAAIEALKTRERGRVILVIASGADRGSEIRLGQLIELLTQEGIPVFVIQFSSGPDVLPLKELAKRSGGQFIHVVKGLELTRATQAIVRRFANRCTITYRRDGAAVSDEPSVDVRLDSPAGAGGRKAIRLTPAGTPEPAPAAPGPAPAAGR